MRVGQPFGIRYGEEQYTQEPKKKYFIACEGKKTEYRYFEAILEHRSDLGISPLIEMIPINHERNTGSHPLHIFNGAKEALKTYESYFPSVDHLCIIADRDLHSFIETQYDTLAENCLAEGIDLFISNPCFELWLLMHYSDLIEYNKTKLLENKKTGERTQTELYLKDKLGGSYSKKYLHFESRYKNHLSEAIEHSKQYATTIEELKNQVGTNVGFLVETLMKD